MTTIALTPASNLTAACAAANPGDILELGAGTYSERVIIETSGTAAAPITMRAAVPGTVTMDGLGSLKHLIQLRDYASTTLEVAYWRFQDFTITNASEDGIKGNPLAHDVELRNIISHTNGEEGIFFQGDDDPTPNMTSGRLLLNGCHAYNNGGHGIKVSGRTIHVRYCYAYSNGTSGGADNEGLQISDNNYDVHVLGGSYINNPGDGIRQCAKGGSVVGAYTRDNGNGGITLSGTTLPARSIRIADCTCLDDAKGAVLIADGVQDVSVDNLLYSQATYSAVRLVGSAENIRIGVVKNHA